MLQHCLTLFIKTNMLDLSEKKNKTFLSLFEWLIIVALYCRQITALQHAITPLIIGTLHVLRFLFHLSAKFHLNRSTHPKRAILGVLLVGLYILE